jgi:hypothetical protein
LKAAAGDTVNTIARRGGLSSSDERGRFGFVQNQEARTANGHPAAVPAIIWMKSRRLMPHPAFRDGILAAQTITLIGLKREFGGPHLEAGDSPLGVNRVVPPCVDHFRSTPNNGRRQTGPACLKRANNRPTSVRNNGMPNYAVSDARDVGGLRLLPGRPVVDAMSPKAFSKQCSIGDRKTS